MCEHRYLNNTFTVFYMNNVWTQVSQQHMHCVLHEQCVNTGISTTHTQCSTWTTCEHEYLNNTRTEFYMNNVWTQESQQHIHCVLHEQCVNMSILTHALCSTWTTCELKYLNNTFPQLTQCICQCILNTAWKKEKKTEVEYIMMCTLLIACLFHFIYIYTYKTNHFGHIPKFQLFWTQTKYGI